MTGIDRLGDLMEAFATWLLETLEEICEWIAEWRNRRELRRCQRIFEELKVTHDKAIHR